MKVLYRSLCVFAVVAIVGCNQTPPGGPGADKDKNKPTGTGTGPTGTKTDTAKRDTNGDKTVGTPDNAFKLSLPATGTTIKQGEKETVTIGISRGKNFDQDVKLDFSGAPDGVKITPADGTLKASEKDEKVTIDAAKDAALGDHTITVKGTPAKSGEATTGSFKITVKKP